VRTLSACVALCCLSVSAFTAAPPPKVPAEWLKLIDQLGEDEDVKTAAVKKLTDLGEDVVPALRRAEKAHPDVDVRLRAGVVAAAIEEKVYREVRRFTGSAEGVAAFALSPDGKKMASGCWGTGLTESVARVWDVRTGKQSLKLEGHASGIPCLAWSPDGERILTGGLDRSIRLWDAGNGKLLRTIEDTHRSFVHAVLFTPDGKKAVSCGLDTDMVVWDLGTGKEHRRIRVHTAAVRSLAWMPGGKRIASAGFDGAVRITDVETGKEVRKMNKGHLPGAAWFVAVSPDGKRIASTGSDRMVRLWDAETGEQLKQFAGHTQGVHGIAYSRDGKRLLSCAESARLWSVETGKEIQRIETPDRVTCVAFSADDAHAIFSCYDKTLRLWRVRK
jgi:WD40 repeat protein